MKIWLMTLGFNSPNLIKESILLAKKQNNKIDFDHEWCLIDQGFPLPSKKENTKLLQEFSNEHDIKYLKPYKNRGVSRSWNWFMNEVEARDEDIIIGVDPDGRPQKDNWINAMADVFLHEDDAYCVQLNQRSHGGHKSLTVEERVTKNGTAYLSFPHIVAWSMGGFRVAHINKIGGLRERRPFYGFIEDETHAKMQVYGLNFYKLRDYYDDHLFDVNVHYRDWKKAMVMGLTDKDLEGWLKENEII